MQKANIKFIIGIGFLLTIARGFAQEPMALYYLETLPQSTLLNPASDPRCNGYFGIPGINTLYFNFQTDVSQKAFFQRSDSGQ